MNAFPKRMFIAVPVGVDGIDLVRAELKKAGSCLKVVPGNNYHLTLKFLGDTDRAGCDRLVEALDSSERPLKAECVIRGLGCFPGPANPTVIWAGMDCEGVLMDRVFFFAEKAAVAAGFPPEKRKFIPHLTLARVRRELHFPPGLKDYIKNNRDTVYSRCVIDRVILFESVLKKGGPEYTVYKEWKLS